MKSIEIYDPAMCCSTGVCGPSIDPELMRIAAVINGLKQKGITIRRHGLSNEPQDFISNKVISDLLQKEGADILPITLLDGAVIKTGTYPTNAEIAQWLETEIPKKYFKVTGQSSCGPKGCC